jgi:lipid-A-disaccharide synthase
LPPILEATAHLGADYEFLLPVAPTLSRAWFESLIGERVPFRLVSESLSALAHSRVGIIASGTATIEAAIVGAPFVMVYRVAPLTYFLGRPWVKVPHLAMVNLVAGREVVPELKVRESLRGPDHPAERAAEVILRLWREHRC